jgi:hypothetical protein
MSSRTMIVVLAIALGSASAAMASPKHPVRHEVGPAIEQGTGSHQAYGYESSTPASVRVPTYIQVQDQFLEQSMGN